MGLDFEFRAVMGDPWTELTRAANERKADAVVVGAPSTPGTGSWARWRPGWSGPASGR